jgi:transcriptional regulator NrdR family protein
MVCQYSSRWTGFGSVNIAKKIVANKKSLELKFSRDKVAGGEFKWGLNRSVYGDELKFIIVENG